MTHVSRCLRLTLLLAGALVAAAAERPTAIRIAFSGAGPGGKGMETGGVLMAAYRQGRLEAEFKPEGIHVEWQFLASGARTTEAFLERRLEFAAQGNLGAITGRAAGLRHKVLLALSRFGSGYLVARADSPVEKLQDLRGKRLGTIRGLAGDLTLRRILESEGFSETDFEMINLEGGATILFSALAAGRIDAHFMSGPFDLEAQGKVKIIYDSRSDLEISGMGLFLVAEEFEQAYPLIVQRVVDVLVRTAAWTAGEENRADVFRLWAESPTERLGVEKKWAGLSLQAGLSPRLDDYVRGNLRRCEQDARRFGFIAHEVNLGGWLEDNYVRRAITEQALQDCWPYFDRAGRKVIPVSRP